MGFYSLVCSNSMSLFSQMVILIIEYGPICFLSVFAGISGLIKRRQLNRKSFLEAILSNGLLGVITLVLLNDFTDLSNEAKYAVVALCSYIGADEALDLFLKLKGFKK